MIAARRADGNPVAVACRALGVSRAWFYEHKDGRLPARAQRREQGLAAQRKKKRKGTTRPGKGRWQAPDLVRRDFPATQISKKWYGDGCGAPISGIPAVSRGRSWLTPRETSSADTPRGRHSSADHCNAVCRAG
jgi:hypothetical protein